MRFAFLADIPDWALHRQGLGLVKSGAVDGHRWDLLHVRPQTFSSNDLLEYDAVRLGGAGLLQHAKIYDWLPREATLICSLASFTDVASYDAYIRDWLSSIIGFCTVDQRIVAQAAHFKLPAMHVADRTDRDTFFPRPELRPTKGPLRIGWAGSVQYWPGIKNPQLIEEACAAMGCEFVRQDRELDGQKSAEEMALWFNGLDAYAVANVENTPTPVPWIEAAACGIPIIGTRCGELWPLLEAHCPEFLLASPCADELCRALDIAQAYGRAPLVEIGMSFQRAYDYFLYWDRGIAAEFTRFVAALCEGKNG